MPFVDEKIYLPREGNPFDHIADMQAALVRQKTSLNLGDAFLSIIRKIPDFNSIQPEDVNPHQRQLLFECQRRISRIKILDFIFCIPIPLSFAPITYVLYQVGFNPLMSIVTGLAVPLVLFKLTINVIEREEAAILAELKKAEAEKPSESQAD